MNKFNFIKDFDFSKLDFVLVTLFLVLGFFGLLILSSASAHFSDSIYGNPSAIFNRQFFYFILGFRSYETSLEGVFTIPQDWNCDFFIYTFN